MNITGITLAEAWRNGGPLMWVLAGLSVIALAIILYLLVAQRRGAVTPHALISDVFSRLQAGDHGEARRLISGGIEKSIDGFGKFRSIRSRRNL
ncbi:MAG: hypothetical protein IJL17_05230, partial [Kiritimatiellae bacterium]|nr:hypothetical protein [Kiritimatiellia bacterium]